LEGRGNKHLQTTNRIEVFHSLQFARKGTVVKPFRYPCLPFQPGAIFSKLRGEQGGLKERFSMNMSVRKEIASSLVLILFGVGCLLYNTKYPMDTWANPGPGIFPLIVGGLLVILAAWQLAQAVRKTKPEETKEGRGGIGSPIRELLQRNRGEVRPLLMIAVFIVYLLMVKWVGFFVSNFLFVIVASKLIGAKDWGRPIVLSAGISLFCYFLFEVWLKLSFPRGVLF
jgi:hypothetical protein